MSSRSIWKGPYVHRGLLKKVNTAICNTKFTVIKTWSRGSTIIPSFTGLTISVYNGRRFIPIEIKETMIGKKLGEFSPTRNFSNHTNSK